MPKWQKYFFALLMGMYIRTCIVVVIFNRDFQSGKKRD